MLVLSRKINENIVIDGRIIVKVVRTEGSFVKIGIEAPADVPVHRQEIYDEIQRSNQDALANGRPTAPRLFRRAPAAASAPSSAAQPQSHGGTPPGGPPVPTH
jgi:carbon storage regulator